jgi:RNA polymerase sigma-70 factor (ECF subfamily)
MSSENRDSGFERLALPLLDSLFNFACWLTRNVEEAEDLVQETYAKAWKGFGSFRSDCSFRTWIFCILRNTFLTYRVNGHASLMVSFDEEQHEAYLPCTQETPESILLDRVHLSLIRNAIDELPLSMREIILLREVEEMSYQEIGTALGIPPGTVMSRLARARQTLRKAVLAKVGGGTK